MDLSFRFGSEVPINLEAWLRLLKNGSKTMKNDKNMSFWVRSEEAEIFGSGLEVQIASGMENFGSLWIKIGPKCVENGQK